MDPNQYMSKHQAKQTKQEPKHIEKIQTPNNAPKSPYSSSARKQSTRTIKTNGKLCISAKRFFGQILIDHWVIKINGEQKELPFGRSKLTLDLPVGVYLVTAYTPYLGMHCMRVTADIEIRPGQTTHIFYQTVFNIFKNGIMKQNFAAKS